MINLILFSVISGNKQVGAAPKWIQKLSIQLHSNKPRAGSHEASVHDSYSMNDPEVLAYFHESSLIASTASLYIQEGRPEDSYRYLLAVKKRDPIILEASWVPMVTSEILTKRCELAFNLMTDRLSRGEYFDDNGYLWLSIASAALGKLNDGQSSYVQAVLTRRLNEGRSSYYPVPSVSLPTTAHQVWEESLVAMGIGYEPAYLELALSDDPKNDLVARQLIGLYAEMGRYSAARQVCLRMKGQGLQGESLKYYSLELTQLKGLDDRKKSSSQVSKP